MKPSTDMSNTLRPIQLKTVPAIGEASLGILVFSAGTSLTAWFDLMMNSARFAPMLGSLKLSWREQWPC